MAKKVTQYFWEADAKIRILESPGLAFSVQTKRKKDQKSGGTFFEFVLDEWMNGDNIYLDVGKRLRGWFKQQAKTVRPSLADSLQYGLRCLSKPNPGFIKVGSVGELEGMSSEPDEDLARNYRLPESMNGNLPYPVKDTFVTGTGKDMRSVFSFMYILPKPVELEVRLISFARNFTPEMAKWMLEKLGRVQGIGDKFSQGYGIFELVEFNSNSEEIPI